MTVRRTPINPWPWSLQFGYNQAEIVEGKQREVICAGQTSMSSEGTPLHEGDMGAQIATALDNLQAVLKRADMDLSNIVRLNIYTMDIDQFFASMGVLSERLEGANVMPPGTLLGVQRLAFPELMVELEATAVD